MPAGFNPIPGTPAYEQYVKNLLNATNTYTPGFTQNSDQMGAGAALSDWQKAVGMGNIDPLGILGAEYLPGAGAAGASSGSSSSFSGPGSVMPSLMDIINEGLGVTRGVGEKDMEKARRRLTEDYDTARDKKMNDLARRGLFRAGIGEEEMLGEVDKPFTRGLSDLESAMHDSNVDTGLSKAGRFADFGSLLAEIEAQARRGAAEKYAKASSIGTGGQTLGTGSGGFGDSARIGTGGDGGMFGASFADTRSGGGGGGGTSYQPISMPTGGDVYSGYYDPITGQQSGYSPPPGTPEYQPPNPDDPYGEDPYGEQQRWDSLYGPGGSAGPQILNEMYPGGYNPYQGGQIDNPFAKPTAQMRLNLPSSFATGTMSSGGSSWL